MTNGEFLVKLHCLPETRVLQKYSRTQLTSMLQILSSDDKLIDKPHGRQKANKDQGTKGKN